MAETFPEIPQFPDLPPDNPGTPDTPENPRPSAPNTGGGCGEGMVFSELDVNGNWVGNIDGTAGECVDAAEAERRRGITVNPPKTGGGGTAQNGATPAGRPNYGPAPMFDAPVFEWGEEWQAPTLEEAMNEPGYKMAADEGSRALQQSAAAKGVLGSGGTLKDVAAWGNKFAEQNYNNVYGRQLQGYNTRFGTAKDIFDRFYTGKKDEYAPKLFEWQTNAHGADLGFAQQWQNFWKNTLSAQDIWNGQG